MSNKPGFFRQLKDTQNYSTKFLIVLFSPNSGVTPIITDDLYGRSGVVFGAYLPYGSVQSDVMGQIVTTANDTFDSNNTNNDDSLSIHQKQPDTGITPHDRHQPASTIDIKSIMRKLAKSATSNLEEYATAINEYIADTKNRATDSLNELATASEQQQRTIRELIKQTGTATATAKQLILEREKPQQAPQPAPSEQEKENKKGEPAQAPQPAPSEQEKENNKGKPAQAPQPAPPTHSTNRPACDSSPQDARPRPSYCLFLAR